MSKAKRKGDRSRVGDGGDPCKGNVGNMLRLANLQSISAVRSHLSEIRAFQKREWFRQVSAQINPSILPLLKIRTRFYLVFIDAAWARAKKIVAGFLESHKSVMTYGVLGDVDFACLLATDDRGVQTFREDLTKHVEEHIPHDSLGPADWNIDQNIFVWMLQNAFVLGGRLLTKAPQMRNNVDLSFLERAQTDAAMCAKKQSIPIAEDMERRGIIHGYSALYDPVPIGRQRFLVLLCDAKEGELRRFMENEKILRHMSDFYTLRGEREIPGSADQRFAYYQNQARAVAVVEVSSMQEYRDWQDVVETALPDCNVFPFMVLHTIRLVPLTVGNMQQFENILAQYRGDPIRTKRLALGTAMHYEAKLPFDIQVNVLDRHVLVCGAPHCGKSRATILWLPQLVKSGLMIHLVNANSNSVDWAREIFPPGQLNEVDLKALDSLSSLSDLPKQVNVYPACSTNEDCARLLTRPFLALMEGTKESGIVDKQRNIQHFVLIDEAHQVFFYDEDKKAFVDQVVNLANRGISVCILTHSLTDPWLFLGAEPNRENIADRLDNKVFFKIQNGRAQAAAALKPEESLYEDLEHMLGDLQLGEALISFVDLEGKRLAPVHVKMRLFEPSTTRPNGNNHRS